MTMNREKGPVIKLICTLFTGHPVRRVFFMRYSHEYKLECIELYRQGIWPETPEGIKSGLKHQKG